MNLRRVLSIIVILSFLVCGSFQVDAAGDDRSLVNNSNNAKDLAKELIRASAHGNTLKVNQLMNQLKKIFKQGADVNCVDIDDYKRLIWYSWPFYKEFVKLLINSGVDVTIGEFGYITLEWAVYRGHTEIVKLLIEKNVEVSTEFILAAQIGHTDIVELLCENRINVHLKNSFGKTALDYARERKNQRMIEAIERHILPPKNCGMNNNNNN